MSKVNKNEPCFFCGTAPCSCASTAPDKSRKSKVVQKASSAKANTDNFLSGKSIPEARKVFKVPASTRERDLSLESALRALLPILASRDKKRVKKELNRELPHELDKRLSEWRIRHGKPVSSYRAVISKPLE